MTAEERIAFQNGMILGITKASIIYAEDNKKENDFELITLEMFAVTSNNEITNNIPMELHNVVLNEDYFS